MAKNIIPQPELRGAESPQDIDREMAWGSDAIAALLEQFDCKYVALNPGSSYRGLHDSLVNHNGNQNPRLLMCLHEEHTVAIAHGYAKVTGKPMLAAVHSNVGLMHASMAIFNAWCDRVPVIVLGATGPVDAAQRRPWIEWIHTSRDQGALVRDYTKWDDQPASLDATLEALQRGKIISETMPQGPVYICMDVSVQEAPVSGDVVVPNASQFQTPAPPMPDVRSLEQAVDWLSQAERPLILMGRVSRDESDWKQRVQLAETLQAKVITDLKLGAAFPVNHALHIGTSLLTPSPDLKQAIQDADVVLSLDWVDLGGTLNALKNNSSKVIHATLDHTLANGWAQDVMTLPSTDLFMQTTADNLVSALIPALGDVVRPLASAPEKPPVSQIQSEDGCITLRTLAAAFREASEGMDTCLVRLPIGWPMEDCVFEHPLDYLGIDGGGGIGSGPGMSVGAGLGLLESDRIAVSILGDGDFMMGCTALWTAARYDVPLLIITANNMSFYNDEVHQEIVANERGRSVTNKWIGQHIRDPEIDLPAIARAQGWENSIQVTRPEDLVHTIRQGLIDVQNGGRAFIDVLVQAGYQSKVLKT